jgi:hypothetical protein
MRKKIEKKEEYKMKKILGIFVLVLLIATVFAALPMNAGAGNAPDKEVPFKGNFDGNTVPSGNPYVERIEMSGQASHLGLYTAVVEAYMPGARVIGYDSNLGLPIVRLPTTTTFTAANGDELYANLVLIGPFGGNFPYFALTGTITGGTGRFDGATGSFSGPGAQTDIPGQDNDLISGTFTGSISIVGSN